MMLFTDRDDPADWLRAGQALQRALLTATSLGVSASFLTQPLELADLAFRYDPQYGGLHHGPLPRRDNCQQNSRNAVDRRGYVRRRILGSTPWLEVPQMVIRVGYPKVSAGQPGIRTPRQEPEVVDVRSDLSQRVIRSPGPLRPGLYRRGLYRRALNRRALNRRALNHRGLNRVSTARAASRPGRADHRLTAH